jgi:Glycosyltransferase family 87
VTNARRFGRAPNGLVALADRVLPLWFLGWSISRLIALGWTSQGWDPSFFGRDFWIYRNAGRAVLDGTNPWEASHLWNGTDWHFAAPPPAAQLFVPFAVLPDGLALALFLVVSVGAAWLGLRRLRLPPWWLLFTPMTEGILAANPQVLIFGLVVLGGSALRPTRPGTGLGGAGWLVGRAVAVGLKVYAIVPIVARREWRSAGAVALLLTLSVATGAGLWERYLTELASISSRIVGESDGGVSAALFLRPSVFSTVLPNEDLALVGGLLIYGLLALLVLLAAVRDVVGAGWIAAPLLFPAAEYHLATMAIPAARRLAIWVLAIPTIPTYLLGLIILAYQVTARHPALVHEDEGPEPLSRWLSALRPRRSPVTARSA